MKLLYRLGYYLGGFSVGLIFLAFILNGKKTSCNYTPNARVIDNLLQKEIVIPDAILNSNPQLSTDQIKEIIKRGNVNFSKIQNNLNWQENHKDVSTFLNVKKS